MRGDVRRMWRPGGVSRMAKSVAASQLSDIDQVTNNLRTRLKAAMLKARRQGYWFALRTSERSFYALAIRLQIKFQSLSLIRALVKILKRLRELGDDEYAFLEKGTKIAWAFSSFAEKCGNFLAHEWRHDRNYIMYLGKFLLRAL
jgi:hypothetical protein